jgi:chromosome segregation ATPase
MAQKIHKTIDRIRRALPEVEHIAMFFDDGTVFQTTFEQFEESVNIPKLGEDLADILSSFRKLYEICNYDFKNYNQLLFDTESVDILFIRLGENSNLALFFRKLVVDGELQINSIKRYVTKIEKLMDIGQMDLIERDIRRKDRDLKHLYENMDEKLAKQKELQTLLGASKSDISNIEKIELEIQELTDSIKKLEVEKEQSVEETSQIKDKLVLEEERIELVSKEVKIKQDTVKDLNRTLRENNKKKQILENAPEEEKDASKLQVLIAETEEIAEKSEIAEQKVLDIKIELDNLKQKLEADKSRITSVEIEIQSKDLQIQERYKELEAKLEKEKNLKEIVDIKEDFDKFAQIEHEILTLNNQIEEIKLTSSDKDKELKEFEKKIEDLEKEIEKYNKTEQKYKEDISELKTEIKEKERDMKEIKILLATETDEKKIKKYEKELEKLDEDICDCQDNSVSNKTDLEKCRSELLELIKKLKKERGRLERTREEIMLKDKQLETLYKELETELSIQKTMLSQIDSEDDFKKVSKITKDIHELDYEMNNLKEDIIDLKNELKQLKDKIQEEDEVE